ncbi:lipopolysaccharide biosynthesis protein [Pseudooceanicola sp.]|uniref:lipopolysaccharide biosynthesis protein n=1 Tax=Pseudooceanicola sp. TaxID=1914328 RepID=UPI0035C6FB5F
MAQPAIVGLLVRRGRELLPRVALVGGILLANVILAYLMLPPEYGAIALVAFVVKNCHPGTLGLTQGYLYNHYNNEGTSVRSYAVAYLVLGVIYYGIAAIVMDSVLLLFCLPFVILFAMEPYLRTQRDFSAILVPEFIFLVSVVLTVMLTVPVGGKISTPIAGAICILLALAYLVVVIGRHANAFLHAAITSKFAFGDIKNIIRNGFPGYIGTLLAFTLLVADRQFILMFYGDTAMGIFMLAFQACLIISVVSSLLNATSIVDLGNLLEHSVQRLVRHMRQRYVSMLAINLVLWFLTVGFLWLFADILFPEFKGVTVATIWMGLGIVCQAAFYSVSPYLFFKKRQSVVNYVMMGVLVLKVVAYYVMAQFGFDWLAAVAVQSALLSIGMVSSTIYLYFIVSGHPLFETSQKTQAE